MDYTLDIDGKRGIVAIYSGADDAPMGAPLSNIARLSYHSGLDYISVVTDRTGSQPVQLAKRKRNTRGTATTKLFSHGRVGVPLVFGAFRIGGDWISSAGGIPIQQTHGTCRWITIGANASDVFLQEQWAASGDMDFKAMSVAWRVWVTDERLD